MGLAWSQAEKTANREGSIARAGYHRDGMLPCKMRGNEDGISGWRVAALGLVAFLTLLPVTLPVSVLRAFVADRFAVRCRILVRGQHHDVRAIRVRRRVRRTGGGSGGRDNR